MSVLKAHTRGHYKKHKRYNDDSDRESYESSADEIDGREGNKGRSRKDREKNRKGGLEDIVQSLESMYIRGMAKAYNEEQLEM